MQVNDLLEPNVRIRELKKDRVNFVLENVDLAYVTRGHRDSFLTSYAPSFANSLRRVMMADIPTVGAFIWPVNMHTLLIVM